jgi:predicted ATP-grasp superfamily ATP-dependent carboligase
MIRMPAPSRTILIHEYVTGGGLAGCELPPSLAAEGNAMRRAVAEDFTALPGVRVVATRDVRLPDNERSWTTVHVPIDEELGTLLRLAREADYTVLIAPETGGILCERARLLEETARPSLGCASGAIALAGDKLVLSRVLAAAGIATPETRLLRPGDELPRDIAYPFVVKPRDGAGAVDTMLVANGVADLASNAIELSGATASTAPSEGADFPTSLVVRTPPFQKRGQTRLCHEFWPTRPEMIVQPYVPGAAMSASFIIAGDGRSVLIGIARQRIARIDHRLNYLGGTLPIDRPIPIEPLLGALDAVPGLRGWVGVDFIWDEETSRVTILEINPRLTTSYVGFRRLGTPGLLTDRLLTAAVDPASLTDGDWIEQLRAATPVTFSADGTIKNEVGAE